VALTGSGLPSASHHVAAILLTNAESNTPVALDYRPNTTVQTNGVGDIAAIRLTIPPGTQLPAQIRAYVILDAFPIARSTI
jgi:hypothetical protein